LTSDFWPFTNRVCVRHCGPTALQMSPESWVSNWILPQPH
jgi:hypothetical protein